MLVNIYIFLSWLIYLVNMFILHLYYSLIHLVDIIFFLSWLSGALVGVGGCDFIGYGYMIMIYIYIYIYTYLMIM